MNLVIFVSEVRLICFSCNWVLGFLISSLLCVVVFLLRLCIVIIILVFVVVSWLVRLKLRLLFVFVMIVSLLVRLGMLIFLMVMMLCYFVYFESGCLCY